MNKEQLQFLGIFGIFKESLNIILSCPKIFTKITLAFILPFNLFSLVNLGIFKFIFSKIVNIPSTLDKFPTYFFSSEKNLFYAIQVVSFIFVFQYSLLSVTSVIYTAACIHTNNEVTFRKVLSVSLKNRKRLLKTMICHSMLSYVVSLAIPFITFLIIGIGLIFGFSFISMDMKVTILLLTLVAALLLFVGALYMIMNDYWKLDNVITVLENYCGFKAMKRSKELIKGNIGTTSAAISMVQLLCSMPIYALAMQFMLSNGNVGLRMEIVYGVVFLVLNPLIMLFGLVIQTIFYFVCKSHHNESIDNFFLSDYLSVSKLNEDYIPLKSEDVEIDRLNA